MNIEMHPQLPRSPQQDLLPFPSGASSGRIFLFDRKAREEGWSRMAKKLIMFALKVGDAFQSKIPALQRSDGISPLYGEALYDSEMS